MGRLWQERVEEVAEQIYKSYLVHKILNAMGLFLGPISPRGSRCCTWQVHPGGSGAQSWRLGR